MDYYKGKVKFFVEGDGYGFMIIVGQDKDIFFHKEYGGRFVNNVFVQCDVAAPKKDDVVILQLEKTGKGHRAKWWCHEKDFQYAPPEYCYIVRTGYKEQHPRFATDGAFEYKILIRTDDLEMLRREFPRKMYPVFEKYNLKRFFTSKGPNETKWTESYDPR